MSWLNSLPADHAERVFRSCHGAPAWAAAMTHGRPYPSAATVLEAAERSAAALTRDDWLAAFDAHPRIGARGGLSTQSQREQAGAGSAPETVLAALAEANAEYERRFGFVFLICASGLDAERMLAALRERLDNDPATEWATALGEHGKITALRLGKLVVG
ncbi:MAG: 2-oxo-4-hydroxy-4-carboxy-5-ureidoimidazoline decarboxylase [Mycobacteriales bacterium]